MNEKEKIRWRVLRAYTDAVSRRLERGGRQDRVPTGVVAKLAGYDSEALCSLPAGAVADAFGCGDPLSFAEVAPGSVVLDLGCGAGIDLLLAGRKVGPEGSVIGVDMNEAMIAKARENIAASGLRNVQVRRGEIEQPPVEAGSVDWVISNCVVNLSPDKPRAFAEIARVLKPGGRMLICDIVVEELPSWVRRLEALSASCVVTAISEEEYLAGLRRAGLDQVEVSGRLVYDASQLQAFIRSEVLPGLQEGLLDEETIGRAAAAVAGRIWSATIHARKPLAPARV